MVPGQDEKPRSISVEEGNSEKKVVSPFSCSGIDQKYFFWFPRHIQSMQDSPKKGFHNWRTEERFLVIDQLASIGPMGHWHHHQAVVLNNNNNGCLLNIGRNTYFGACTDRQITMQRLWFAARLISTNGGSHLKCDPLSLLLDDDSVISATANVVELGVTRHQ